MESEPDTEHAIPAGALPVTSIADMEMDMAGDMDLVSTGVDFNSALDVNHLLGIGTGTDTSSADTEAMLGIKIDTGADTDAMLGIKIDTGADTDAMLGIKIDTGADTDAMFGSSTTGLLEESMGGVDMSCSQSSEASSDVQGLLGMKTDDTYETPFMSTRPSALSLQDNTSDLFPVDFPSNADDSNTADVMTTEDEKLTPSEVVGSAETKGDVVPLDYSLSFKESGICAAVDETKLDVQASSPAEMEEPCFKDANILEYLDGNSVTRARKDDVIADCESIVISPGTKCDELTGNIDAPKGGNDISNLCSPAVEHLLIATGEPLPKVVPRKRKQVAAAGTRRSSRLKQTDADEQICLESRTGESEGDSVDDEEDVSVSDALKQDNFTKDNPSGDGLVETVQVPEKSVESLDDDVTLPVHRNTHNVSRRGRTKKLGQGREPHIECTAIADPHVQTSIECSPNAPMLDEEKDLATDGAEAFPEIAGTENSPDAPMLDKEKDSAVGTGASSEVITTECSPDAPMLDNEKDSTADGENESPNTVGTASDSSATTVVSVSVPASGKSDHGKTNTSGESHVVSDSHLTVDASIITDKLETTVDKPTESQQETKITSSSEDMIMASSEHMSTIIPTLLANKLQDSVVEGKLEVSTEITPESVVEGTAGLDDESIVVTRPPPRANVARRARGRRRGRPASTRGAKRQRMMVTEPDTETFTDSSPTVDKDLTIVGTEESQENVGAASGVSSVDAYVSMCVTGECDRSKINPSEDSQDVSEGNVTAHSSVSPEKLEEPKESLEVQPESDVTPNSEDTVMVSTEDKNVTVRDSPTSQVADSVLKDNDGEICSKEVENTAIDSGQAQSVDEQEITSNMVDPSTVTQSYLPSMDSGDSNDTVDYSGELLDITEHQFAMEQIATTGPAEGGISCPEGISCPATSEERNTMGDAGTNEQATVETDTIMSSIGSSDTLVSNSEPAAVVSSEANASGELAASSEGTPASLGAVTIEGQVSHVLGEIVTAIENNSGDDIIDTGHAVIDNSSDVVTTAPTSQQLETSVTMDVTATGGDSNPTPVQPNDSQQAAPGKAMTVETDGGSSSIPTNPPVSPGGSLCSDGPLLSQGPPVSNEQPRYMIGTPTPFMVLNPNVPVKSLLGLQFPTQQEGLQRTMPRLRFCGPSCETLHYGGPCQAQILSGEAPYEDPSQPLLPRPDGPRDEFLHSGPECPPSQQGGPSLRPNCPLRFGGPRPDYQPTFEGPSQPCGPQPRFRGPGPRPDGPFQGPNSQPPFEGPSQPCGPQHRFRGPGPRPDGPFQEPDFQPTFEGPSQPCEPQHRFRGPGPRPDGPFQGPNSQPQFEGPSQPCGPQHRFRGPGPRPDGISQPCGPQPRFRGPGPRPDGPFQEPDYQPTFEGPSQPCGPQHRFRGPGPRPDGPFQEPDYQPTFEGPSQPCGPQPRFRGPGPRPDGPCQEPDYQPQCEGPSQPHGPRFRGPGPRPDGPCPGPNSQPQFEGTSQPCGPQPRFRGPGPRPDGPCPRPDYQPPFEGPSQSHGPRFRGPCPRPDGPFQEPDYQPQFEGPSQPRGPRFRGPGPRPDGPCQGLNSQPPFEGPSQPHGPRFRGPCPRPDGPCQPTFEGPQSHGPPSQFRGPCPRPDGPPGANGPRPQFGGSFTKTPLLPSPGAEEPEYNTNWSEQQGGPPGCESEYNTNWSEQQGGPPGCESEYNTNWSEQQGGPPGFQTEYNTNWSEEQGGQPGFQSEYNTNWSEQQGDAQLGGSFTKTPLLPLPGAEGQPGQNIRPRPNYQRPFEGPSQPCGPQPRFRGPGPRPDGPSQPCGPQPRFRGPGPRPDGPSQPCGPQPRFRGPGPMPDGPSQPCGPQPRFRGPGPRPDGPSQPCGPPIRFRGPCPRADGPPCDVPYSELEGPQTPNRGYCPGANGPRPQFGAQSSPPFNGPRFKTPFQPAAFRPNLPDPSLGAAQLGGSFTKTPLLPLPGQSGQNIGHERTASDIGSQPDEIATESCKTETAMPDKNAEPNADSTELKSAEEPSSETPSLPLPGAEESCETETAIPDKGTEQEPKADSTELKSTEEPASVVGDESQETKPSEEKVKQPLLTTPADYADAPPPGDTNWVELQMAPPGCESENNTNWSEHQGPPPGCKPEYNANWSQQQGPPPGPPHGPPPGYDSGSNTNWSQQQGPPPGPPHGPPPGYDSGCNTNWSEQQGPPPGYTPGSNNWSEQQGPPPGWRQPSGPPQGGMGPPSGGMGPPQQGMGPPQQGMGPPPQQGMGPSQQGMGPPPQQGMGPPPRNMGPPQQGMGPPGGPPPQGPNGPRGPPPDWYNQSYTQESPQQGWGYPPQQYQQPYWYGGSNYNDYYNNYYQWYYSGYGQSYPPPTAWSPPNEWSVAANSLAAVAAASTAESNTTTSVKESASEDLVVSTVSNRPMSSIPLPAVNQIEAVTSWPPEPPKAQPVPKPALLPTPGPPQMVPPPKLTAQTATQQVQKPTVVTATARVTVPSPPPPVSQPAPPPRVQHVPTPVPQRVVPMQSVNVVSPPPAISLPTPFAALQGIGGKSVR